MCLAVINWNPKHSNVLKVVANRDEFRARPSKPMHWWPEKILAGQDLEAGGTWLGFNTQGQFALLTNIRPGFVGKKGSLSRGELVKDFLIGQHSISEFHGKIKTNIEKYGGFNLLLGNVNELFWFSSTMPEGQYLAPGIHGLSNDALNTPWPKTELAKKQMADFGDQLDKNLVSNHILTSPYQADTAELPSTGVPLEWESKISAQTIIDQEYGTRCRTFFTLSQTGIFEIAEQQINENGLVTDTQKFSINSIAV